MKRSQPNILVVVADQLRGFDLGYMGDDAVATPHIDQFARTGFSFNTAFANSPVCTPSRGSLLTGLYPLAHGAVANDLPLGRVRSIADELTEHGYETGYIGKWHLDGVPRNKFTPPGERRHGFEYWAAYNCSHDYYRKDKYFRDYPDVVELEGYEPEIQTDLALDFIDSPRERPFALVLSWGPPHDPYGSVPDEYLDRYDLSDPAWRPNVRLPGRTAMAQSLDPEGSIRGYRAAITALDDQFGRLMAGLESAGVAEDTIVVLTSDHGDMLWSHGYVKKQLPYEESVRVPLIVRWPGHVMAGHSSDSLASTIDVAPTLLGLVGLVGAARTLPGNDFSGELTTSVADGPDSVFMMDIVQVDESAAQGLPEWRAVRTQRYLYAEKVGRVPWLLFDLNRDPHELNNLVDDTSYKSVQSALTVELETWLVRVGDNFEEGIEHLSKLGLEELWSAREHEMHGGQKELSLEP